MKVPFQNPRRWCVLLLAVTVCLGTSCRKPLATVIMEKRVHAMKVPRDHFTHLNYLVQLPPGYNDDTNRLWPLVFYLHGLGEGGYDVEKVLRFGPPKLMAQGKDLPCIVVSPQIPDGYFTFRESNSTIEVLDEVMARFRVDKHRVHVTGNSMGAYGAVLLAARDPERFASLVTMAGGVDYVDSLRLRDVPLWAFHGEKDPIIPVEESRRLVRLVNEIGGHARLTIYADLGHNCWDRAYDDPSVWEWILAQKK